MKGLLLQFQSHARATSSTRSAGKDASNRNRIKVAFASNSKNKVRLPGFESQLGSEIRHRLMPTRALTESAQLPLDSVAPPFQLPEPLTGRQVTLDDFKDANALLVIFMCNHCPFVKLLKGGFVQLANDYKDRGVELVGISSNSVDVKPMDGPKEMADDAKEQGYPFPYLFDEDQAVAQRYQAMCTPEFFLFDKDLKLQYHGQFDGARPSNGQPVTGEDVRRAIDDLLSGKEPEVKVKPSIGCNIKWHPGREPAYAS